MELDKGFGRAANLSREKEERSLALDDTVVKADKKRYYVYSAIDVERNELILMKILHCKKLFDYKIFLKEAEYCENRPKFIVDKAHWLINILKTLGLEFKHQPFQ